MQGRRPETTGGVFAAIRRGLFWAENDAHDRGSFTAAERWLSDRLGRCILKWRGIIGQSPLVLYKDKLRIVLHI